MTDAKFMTISLTNKKKMISHNLSKDTVKSVSVSKEMDKSMSLNVVEEMLFEEFMKENS